MLFLALIAADASAEAPAPRLEIASQARASVRIVAGARVTAEQVPKEAIVREAEIVGPDGSLSTAQLVEFP